MTCNKIFLTQPEAGETANYTMPTDTSGYLQVDPQEISGLSLGDAGELVISFADGGQIVIANYEEMAGNGDILQLQDGTFIDPATLTASAQTPQQLNSIQTAAGTTSADAINIAQPAANTTQEVSLQAGGKYVCDFDPSQAAKVEVIDGQMVLTFADGSRVVINNYSEVMAGDLPAELTVADGTVIEAEELLTEVTEIEELIEEEVANVVQEEVSAQDVANIEPAAGEDTIAQELANIEPASGEAGASNSGYGFGSVPSSDPLASPFAIGPLGATALQYGAPQFSPQQLIIDDIPVIGAARAIVDETNLLAGNVVVNGTLDVDYGNDAPGSIVTNGSFSSGSNQTNGVLSHNGTAVVVTEVPGGYEGFAGPIKVFDFTIDNNGNYSFTQYEQLDHSDTTNDNENINLNFGVTVTDDDGDVVPAIIRVDVLDDAPVITSQIPAVVDETNLDVGPLTVNGQFYYDAGQDTAETVSVNGNFQTAGEVDNNVLTSNGNPVTVTFDAGTNTYTGTANGQTVFTNVLNPANGSFAYTQFLPLDHADANDADESLTLEFGVTVTDFDGDARDGFVKVQVHDDAPVTGDDTNTIDESNLDVGPIVVNDSVSVDFGEDGQGELLPSGTFTPSGSLDNGVLSHGGTAITVTPTTNGYVGTAGTTTVFTLDIDSVTGDYTFTLLEPLDHADNNDPNDQITLTFGTVISDFDDDTENGQIIINVLDDAPEIQPNGPEIDKGLENVDETDLDNGVLTETGTLPFDFGEDGAGKVTGTDTFTPSGSMAGGALTSCGYPVTVEFDDNTNTYTGTANGQTVFTLELDPVTGDYTYTQPGTLDHADVNDPNDVITLTFGVAAEDSEGEQALGSVVINVADDAPELDPVQDTVDETDLGPVNVTGAIPLDYGQDGAATTNPFEASGDFASSGSQTAGALTHNGTPVVVTFDNNTNTYTGVAGAVTVFTMTIDEANAEYDFTLLSTLDHADNTDPNDIINLDFGIQTTDKDGDTSESFVRIQVKDDVPTIGDNNGDVDETNFDQGPLVYQDTLQTDAGLDLADVSGNDTFTSSVPLTSEGLPVTVTSVGNTYTGTVNGQTAFTLVVDPTTGQYTYTQLLPLDHPDSNDPNDTIDLNFGVNITDTDGDTDDGTITITVADDAPVANDDITSAEEGQLITGDVTANDDLSEDTPNEVTNVNFDGTDYPVPAVGTATITADYGVLTIAQDGTYTYLANSNDPNGVDTFTYTLVDEDGDQDTATLAVTVSPDGSPVAVNDQLSVDETNLTPGPVVFNDTLNVNFGPDGGGSVEPNGNFSFGGSALNNTLTSNGVPVVVTRAGDVYTGAAGANTVFTLLINDDGTYSFELFDVLDHEDQTDPNDIIDLNFGVTVSDSDGDTSDGTVLIRVHDDAPVAYDDGTTTVDEGATTTGNVTTNDELSEDEVNEVTSITFNGTTVTVPTVGSASIAGNHGTLTMSADGSYSYTANVTLNNIAGTDTFTYALTDYDGDTDTAEIAFDVNIIDDQPVVTPAVNTVDETGGLDTVTGTIAADFGRDIPGTINPNDQFSSSVQNLTSCGEAVTVSLQGDTYTGTAVINGQTTTIFTATILDDGSYTFTQFQPIDHPDTLDHNDNVQLTFGAVAEDSDGDQATTTLTINVLDDGPQIDQIAQQVDEAQLRTQNSFTANGTVPNDFGQDGAGEITANGLFEAKFQPTGANVTLTSGGDAIAVTNTDNVYTGTANGQTVFTLTIDDQTGDYEYEQFAPIDHPDDTDPNDVLWLKFYVDIEDKDGDFDTGTIIIDVQDDGPVAVNDSLSGTSGDLLANDNFGADGEGGFVGFSIGGNQYAPGDTVSTSIGEITINNDGTYSINPADPTISTRDYSTSSSSSNNYSNVLDVSTRDYNGTSTATTRDYVVDSSPTTSTRTEIRVEGNSTVRYTFTTTTVTCTTYRETTTSTPSFRETTTITGNYRDTTTVTTNYRDTIETSGGSVQLEYTIIDADGDTDTATATLSIPVQTVVTGTQNLGSSSNTTTDNLGNTVSRNTESLSTSQSTTTATVGSENKSSETVDRVVISTESGDGGDGDGGGDGGGFGDGTPLVLDLDGDGVELVNKSEGVLFDIDLDGVADQTAWVSGDDGLLALDSNNDGVINDRSELFGDTDGFTDGFDKLSSYDENQDGVIDANDSVFDDLKVWQDVNQDGISQADELHLLSQIGIVSISLQTTNPEDLYIEGNWISHVASYLTDTGETREVVDAWFQYDSGAGAYSMSASENADDFIFQAIQESALEIRNFDLAEDTVDLSALVEGADDLSDAINEFVYTTEVDGSTIISVDVDGADGPAEAQEVAKLQGVTGVSVEDLINNGNIEV